MIEVDLLREFDLIKQYQTNCTVRNIAAWQNSVLNTARRSVNQEYWLPISPDGYNRGDCKQVSKRRQMKNHRRHRLVSQNPRTDRTRT